MGHPAPRLAPATPRSCPASRSLLPTQEPAGLESAFLENLMSPPSPPAPHPSAAGGWEAERLGFYSRFDSRRSRLEFPGPCCSSLPSPSRRVGGHRPLTLTLQRNEASGPSSPSSVCRTHGAHPPWPSSGRTSAPRFSRGRQGEHRNRWRGAGRQSRRRRTVPCHWSPATRSENCAVFG